MDLSAGELDGQLAVSPEGDDPAVVMDPLVVSFADRQEVVQI